MPTQFDSCTEKYIKDGNYNVQLNIQNEWDDGFQGEIKFENISDEPLEGWELSFTSTDRKSVV